MNLEDLDNLEEKIRKIKYWKNMSEAEIFQISGLWSWREARIVNIGKAVLESMIEMYFRDGAMKGVVIPATFQDKEFEIEVRMK